MEFRYILHPIEIIQVIKNVRTSSNDLVGKVLAEETTFEKECKKLESYDKEEFYQKRDELVDALAHYKFGEIIEEKTTLDYKLFRTELKALKKGKKQINRLVRGGLGSGTGGASIAIFGAVTGMLPITLGGLTIELIGLGMALRIAGKRIKLNNYQKEFTTINEYRTLEQKSKQADEFTYDISFLEWRYPIEYEDSEISKLYENNAKGFINYFSSLKKDEEKENVLTLLYASEHRNEEVISWLDENEPELVKKVGLSL